MNKETEKTKDYPFTVEIMFTCKHCGLTKCKFDVRSRNEDEDLKKWLDNVMSERLQEVHLRNSPRCTNRKVDLYIPVNDNMKWIGDGRT